MNVKSFFRKVKTSLVNALSQGWSPEAVCWSAAWGLTIGVFPIYGVTTATLGLMGVIWKLNHTVMQGFNYLAAPLKVALIYPCIRLGEWMFQTDTPFTLSLREFTGRFKAAPLETLGEFAMTFVHAISGWLVSVPFLICISYFCTYVVLKKGSATRKKFKEARL